MKYLISILSFIIVPLLPRYLQEKWKYELPLDIMTLSSISGYSNLIVSIILWAISFIRYEEWYAGRVAEAVGEAIAGKGGPDVPITWTGVLGFITFFFTIKGLLLTIYLIESFIRFISSSLLSIPMGSIFIIIPVFLVNIIRKGLFDIHLTSKYGKSSEPDRIQVFGESLLVCSNRIHSDWNSNITFSFHENLYRLDSMGDGIDKGKPCFEYRFKPWIDNALIRSVVYLDGVIVSEIPNEPKKPYTSNELNAS